MSKHLLRKRPDGAFEIYGNRSIPRAKVGEFIEVTVKTGRSVQHNAKYWTLIKLVWEQQSYFPTANKLHQAVKHATGFAEVLHRKDGTPYTVYDSTSFEAMDQAEFNEYYERVLDFMAAELLPHVQDERARKELTQLLDLEAA